MANSVVVEYLIKVWKALGSALNAMEVTKLLTKTIGFVQSPSFNHMQETSNNQ